MSEGNVILITGASSGFGRLMAETFARKGNIVFASMRQVNGHNSGAREELVALARTKGLSLSVVEIDVTDEASVNSGVEEAIKRAGRINVLVNNAGLTHIGLTEACTLEDVQREFDINFFGAVRMNRAVLPHMRRQGSGLLVYMSSVAGRVVSPFLGVYCASKFALEALAESYHYQLSELGIDSVIIEPGRYGTSAPGHTLRPSDPGRAAGYGKVGEQFERAIQDFMAFFSSPDVPDPKEVIDLVLELIALPRGQRPLRVPVGTGGVLDPINEVAAQVQANLRKRHGRAAS
jgi:NAD(P)-dependent dehydrogenase (short-subunit alcohol dehydrogenase family)